RCRIEQQSGSIAARRNLLEQFQPFASNCRLHNGETGGVTAWPSQVLNEAAANRISNDYKHDRDGPRLLQHLSRRRRVLHKNNFGLQLNQFFRSTLPRFRIIERPPTKFDVDIAAFRPAEFLESFPERGQIIVKFWVALGMRHEYADASRSTGLLRLRRNWPCRRRAANDLDEVDTYHRLPRRLRTRHRSRLNYHTGRGRAWGVIHLSKGRPASRCLPQFEYTPHHWHACAANLGRDHPPSTLIGTCHEPARSPHFDALTDRLCKAQV